MPDPVVAILAMLTMVALGGLVPAWKGRPHLSYFSATILAVVAFLIVVAVTFVPRSSMGPYGKGDGFAILGLFVMGVGALAVAAALGALTATVTWFGRRSRRDVSQTPDRD